MADIKTMTQEITDMNANVSESMLSGDYEEVMRKTKGNATQNLTNVMAMLQHQHI